MAANDKIQARGPRCLVSILLALLVCAPVVATERDAVDVTYPSGDTRLAALLLVPKSERPVPAAVIIQGSGSSDRSNHWSRDMADALVDKGVAVLLTDKRGSGASGGDWRVVGFDELAADALAGVRYLQTRDEIDPRRIGLVGLSQGGRIAPLAASLANDVAFVINVSGTAVGFAEQTFLEMANTARQSGLSSEGVRDIIRLNAAAVRYASTGDWAQYEATRKQVLATDAREIAAGFPASPDLPIWTFYQRVADYDPLFYWTQVSQPSLIVYGKLDEQDNVPVAESVRRLEHAFKAVEKTNYHILVIADSGHGIRDATSHRLANEFIEALDAWLGENVHH